MMQDSLGTSPAMDKLNEPLLINDEEVEEVPSTPTPLFLAPVDESKNRRTQTQKLKIHKRHVKQAIIFFSCLTAAFVILAIVSRNTNEDKYSPPTCTECKVIGSVASNIAQGILPVVYLSALYVSWYNESPRRSLRQFVIDNFKQVVSGSITHFEATGFAILMFNHNTKVSQCDWYLMLFMLDTAYGCFLTVTTHAFTAQLAARFSWSEPLSRVGDYYGKPWPDGTRKWTSCRKAIADEACGGILSDTLARTFDLPVSAACGLTLGNSAFKFVMDRGSPVDCFFEICSCIKVKWKVVCWIGSAKRLHELVDFFFRYIQFVSVSPLWHYFRR
eukprot:m.45071 g.45071  ORF g.45071 m.45071 type:complete len:331 (-) comp15112_c0_seq2:262-1254(-)